MENGWSDAERDASNNWPKEDENMHQALSYRSFSYIRPQLTWGMEPYSLLTCSTTCWIVGQMDSTPPRYPSRVLICTDVNLGRLKRWEKLEEAVKIYFKTESSRLKRALTQSEKAKKKSWAPPIKKGKKIFIYEIWRAINFLF